MTLTSAILAAALAAANPTITYSLPQTVIVLDITAKKEQWHAGIYSAYAKDLLGIEAVTSDSSAVSISSVSIRTETEADQSKRFSLQLDGRDTERLLLSMSSQGLVTGAAAEIRNTKEAKQILPVSHPLQLGVKVSTEGDIEEEAKAAAERIKELKNARYNILVGNTDASYSGDALRAAVEELHRMEDELTVCFTGSYNCCDESVSIEVLPAIDSKNAATVYEAFCLNAKDGILPAGSLDGIPYYLEISAEAIAKAKEAEVPNVETDKRKRTAETILPARSITYRIPAICLVRLTDGNRVLTQLRLPIYQFGIEEEYPIF